MILPSSFYDQDTIATARGLLGCSLVHAEGNETTTGMIVETEAYPRRDPAAHSFHGRTDANSVLFGPPGHAHLFFVYGMHWCMNVVTGTDEGERGAVFLRALEPVKGVPVMQERRGTHELRLLCSGPGRLTQALGITGEFNGVPLNSGPLRISSRRSVFGSHTVEESMIVQTTRVGIAKAREQPYRFYLKGNPHVSRKAGLAHRKISENGPEGI
ncbi:MAG: Putative 3-methyladenine DNA glycosylase [Methanoregula sp. SKADARSKE-2]|nr:MAG: Putative 3-methyladenine DNA glycosylase [Methanoregula sp. SKADARSKE-2]